MKARLMLSIEPKLLEQMKLKAVRDKRSVSNITEECWREFLKVTKAKPPKDGKS